MPSVRIDGTTYEEVAIRARDPIPVDIGGASITFTGDITLGTVTIDNDNLSPVPVSDAGGSLTIDDGGGSITVDGPLTNTELRAQAVTVVQQSQPLPTGGATSALQTAGNASLASLDGKTPAPVGGRMPVDGSGVTQPVSDGGGSLSIDDGGGSVTVDGPLTDAQLRNAPVPVSDGGASLTVDGVVTISGVASTGVAVRTPTTVSVASSSSSQLFVAQNSNRKGLSVSNMSDSKLYLGFSNPATLDNTFLVLQPGAFLMMDQQLIIGNAIYGFWAAANGRAAVTEFA